MMHPNDVDHNPDDVEIIQELGNMFLVRVEGETRQVGNNPKNELLYKHGLYSLLHSESEASRTVLSESDPYVAVAPTSNDSIYSIWYGEEDDFPLQNPPSKANDVLKGIRDGLSEPADYATIKETYEWIRDNQVRRNLIDKLTPMFPSASVIPNEEGWVVEGIFLVTWDARVFISAADLEENSYVVRGGITEADGKREFLSLTPDADPEEVVERKTVRVDGEEHELGEVELMFLAKVQWLLHYNEMYDDDAFWAVIERHAIRGV